MDDLGRILENRREGVEAESKDVSLTDLTKALEHLATALEIFIQLERQSYGLDCK